MSSVEEIAAGTSAEPDPFVQAAPRPANRWAADRALRQAVRRLLPDEAYGHAAADLTEAAQRCVDELAPLASQIGRAHV